MPSVVLVVDDDELVRSVAEEILKSLDLGVITASSGKEAIRIFSEAVTEISVVLLDLRMPHLDGEATYHGLRRICADVPIVFYSGLSSKGEQILAGKPLTAFLSKPFRREELRNKLNEVCPKLVTSI